MSKVEEIPGWQQKPKSTCFDKFVQYRSCRTDSLKQQSTFSRAPTFSMVASFRESQQNCSTAVGVEELKLLARSIRSAAHYYDEAFVDAPDRAR